MGGFEGIGIGSKVLHLNEDGKLCLDGVSVVGSDVVTLVDGKLPAIDGSKLSNVTTTADKITLSTSEFNDNLSSDDNTSQKAFITLDNLTVSSTDTSTGGDTSTGTDSSTSVDTSGLTEDVDGLGIITANALSIFQVVSSSMSDSGADISRVISDDYDFIYSLSDIEPGYFYNTTSQCTITLSTPWILHTCINTAYYNYNGQMRITNDKTGESILSIPYSDNPAGHYEAMTSEMSAGTYTFSYVSYYRIDRSWFFESLGSNEIVMKQEVDQGNWQSYQAFGIFNFYKFESDEGTKSIATNDIVLAREGLTSTGEIGHAYKRLGGDFTADLKDVGYESTTWEDMGIEGNIRVTINDVLQEYSHTEMPSIPDAIKQVVFSASLGSYSVLCVRLYDADGEMIESGSMISSTSTEAIFENMKINTDTAEYNNGVYRLANSIDTSKNFNAPTTSGDYALFSSAVIGTLILNTPQIVSRIEVQQHPYSSHYSSNISIVGSSEDGDTVVSKDAIPYNPTIQVRDTVSLMGTPLDYAKAQVCDTKELTVAIEGKIGKDALNIRLWE